MMKEKEEGFFESFGRDIDEGFRESREDIRRGARMVRGGLRAILLPEESRGENPGRANEEINSFKELYAILMSRANDCVTPTEEGFSYATVLKWVKENHVGNRFYMVRYTNPKSKAIYLFVFFGEDDKIMCGDDYPMICYLTKVLPSGIIDIFNGKDMFIQNFE